MTPFSSSPLKLFLSLEPNILCNYSGLLSNDQKSRRRVGGGCFVLFFKVSRLSCNRNILQPFYCCKTTCDSMCLTAVFVQLDCLSLNPDSTSRVLYLKGLVWFLSIYTFSESPVNTLFSEYTFSEKKLHSPWSTFWKLHQGDKSYEHSL